MSPYPLALIAVVVAGELASAAGWRWPEGDALRAAGASATLAGALLGLAFAAASLARGPGLVRVVTRWLAAASAAALLVLLIALAVTHRLLGHALRPEAAALLLAHADQTALHLLQTEPFMLLAAALGVALVAAACAACVHPSAQASRNDGAERVVAISAVAIAVSGLVLSGEHRSGSETRSGFLPLVAAVQAHEGMVPLAPCRAMSEPMASPAPASAPVTPVIVLLVEALRGDLLETHPQAAPFLAKLATEGIHFERAYATSSHSDFSDLAFWYSRYPLRSPERLGYPRDAPWRGESAFEYFKRYGYSTGYFSSQNERWGDMIEWLQVPGVDAFFDSEHWSGHTWENVDDTAGLAGLIAAGRARAGKVEDTVTLARAAEWVEGRGRAPFVLGMNLQNTHYSYVIPDGGLEPFQPATLSPPRVYYAWPASQATNVRNRYLNAVYNLDRALETFAARLTEAGVWDRSLIVVVGDNGEAFHEHGFGNHSGPMYEPVARTLAIVRFPVGDPRNGRRFTAPVSHVDFVPLAAAGVGLPPWNGFQGRDPLASVRGSPVFMTVDAVVREDGYLDWPWKLLVRSFPHAETELYRLDTDPGERTNLAADLPEKVAAMNSALEGWRACQFRYYAPLGGHLTHHPPRYD